MPAGSPYAARGALAGQDARTLAEEVFATDDTAYRDAFRGSAMKRAKRAGLQRNTRVVNRNRAAIAARRGGEGSLAPEP